MEDIPRNIALASQVASRITSYNVCYTKLLRAEQPDLPSLGIGSQQVDDLDPGLEDLDLGRLVLERGSVPVDSYNFV